MLLRAIMCRGVWNGILRGKAKKEDVPCRFCGKTDGDGHLFAIMVGCLDLVVSVKVTLGLPLLRI